MKKYLLLLGLVVCPGAHTKLEQQSCRAFEIKRHNINQVEMCISNYGLFGQHENGADQGCWWPIGTTRDYIFGAGVWFGTIDSITGDTLVTVGYNPAGGQHEFAPGLMDMSVNHPDAIVYMYPINWPAPPATFPMAPQDTVSHQDSWCCYNDCDSAYHMPGDTRPIGIEVYQTVYAWDVLEIEDMIFFAYEVKNVCGNNLHNCWIGVCTDCDIGTEVSAGCNDVCSAIIERTYVMNNDTILVDDLGYQWQWEAEAGWDPPYPGVIGFDLLQTPFDLEEGADKDGDGILDQYERDSAYYWNNVPNSLWDADNDGVPDWRDPSQWPQLEMTAFKIFTLDLEPGIDPERYMTLAGYNFLTGQYEPYDTIIPDPCDQRFLMSSGPFDLAPDSIVTIVFAVLFADWRTPVGGYIYHTPDSALALVDKWAQEYYDMYWFLYAPGIEENYSIETFNTELTIRPNPTIQSTMISFSLLTSGLVSLKLFNRAGQLVKEIMRGYKNAGIYDVSVDTSRLAQGAYFLVLETPQGKTSRSLVVLR